MSRPIFTPGFGGIHGSLFGLTIIPRRVEIEAADDELRWSDCAKCYIAGPVAWKVLMQIPQLNLRSDAEYERRDEPGPDLEAGKP